MLKFFMKVSYTARMNNSTVLRICANRTEADVIVSLLHGFGIEAIVHGDMGGTHPIYGAVFGVRVLVDAQDLEAAKKLIEPVTDDGTSAILRPKPEAPGWFYQVIKGAWMSTGLLLIGTALVKPPNPRIGLLLVISLGLSSLLTTVYIWRKVRRRQAARLRALN